VLVGKSDELSKHAGHKVEVTGRLDNAGSSSGSTSGTTSGTTGSTSSGTSTSGYGSSSSMGDAKKLHVESIRMISADCSSSSR